jgi:TPP-dependent pyruvate/acetoin dehydrogenase alpha subunit
MDYKLAMISRECSLLGRREVLTGKAKFGIFETERSAMQLAMAKFKNGDFRSGYYRDQTFMMAIELTIEQFLRDCMEILLLSKSQCQQEDKWVDILPHTV